MKNPMFKNQESLEKKLKSIAKAHEKKMMGYANKYIKEAKNPIDAHNWSFQYIKRAKLGIKDALDLQFRKKRCIFVNYKESCDFNPLTGLGHSYRWYELTKVIKGRLVLNTYRYSVQTSKHINKVEQVMNKLGLKFIEISAPRGLQNLDAAKVQALGEYGTAIVKNKYARKKNNYSIKQAKKQIENCKLIGIKFTQKDLKDAIEVAEMRRAERLVDAKAKRLQLMQVQSFNDVRKLTLIQGGAA